VLEIKTTRVHIYFIEQLLSLLFISIYLTPLLRLCILFYMWTLSTSNQWPFVYIVPPMLKPITILKLFVI